MAKFTVRIELHDASYEDYTKLHSAMRNQGFKQLITSDVGITYHLPPAEYDMDSVLDRSHILNTAKSAVSSISKSAGILITESAGRTWEGLIPVR